MAILLYDLPDEVIQIILFYVPPQNLPAVHLTSKRLNRLANAPLLWRHHCRTKYKYWDSKHQIREKFAGTVSSVDWKELYAYRCRVARQTSRMINIIIGHEGGRIDAFQKVVESGYDVKDTLLDLTRAGDEEDDVLARRYWSRAVLGHLHRKIAFEVFAVGHHHQAFSRSSDLETVLVAFDMCVLDDREGDFQEVSDDLDRIAQDFRGSNPNFAEGTPRQQALRLAQFVRERNLTGVEDGEDYMQVENSFIGFALRDEKHRSMPLISVGIYCCLANRLGIHATPVGYPFHVYAVVTPPPSLALDGRSQSPSSSSTENMYLDPFRGPLEVPVDSLHNQLILLGVPSASHGVYLAPASTIEMAIRVCRNLIHTSNQGFAFSANSEPLIDRDLALYTAVWILLQLDRSALEGPESSQFRNFVLSTFETYPEDVPLFEKAFLSRTGSTPQAPNPDMMIFAVQANLAKAKDNKPREPKHRPDAGLRHKVGQVFQHRRYNYRAVITGWDRECSASDEWRRQMSVHRLPGGASQPFYDVLVEDGGTRYVAEENIEIRNDWVPGAAMMKMCGKYFKRWDSQKGAFVSNREEEYPEG